MNKYLLDGLPPSVVNYIKIHLRRIYSTGLFDSQEREDLIQDLVLFYLELIHKLTDVLDVKVYLALKTKADHIMRTRLRELQSGFLNTGSLNSMFEDEGFEPASSFSLSDLENYISISELKNFISPKEQKFIELVLDGETIDNAIRLAHVSKNILYILNGKLAERKKKKKK